MEFEKLKKIIAEVLNVDEEEITLSTTFMDDLGADSLDVFQIIMGIEETFDIEIDNDVLFPNYTPQTSKSNEVLKKGIDTTLNPVNVLWCKTTAPDNQSVVSSGYDTVSSIDLNYKTTTKC